MKLRPQYHFRDSDQGLLAWDVVGLIERVSSLTPVEIQISEIAELDEPHWFNLEGDLPTCRKIAEHAQLIREADLTYPIIVDPEYRVLDGMHRVCKALNQGAETILAYCLLVLPEPDYVGIAPSELPYEGWGAERDKAP
ncbi:MAG: hypothetical protein ACSHYB_13845 [Roseibacillus sp.]